MLNSSIIQTILFLSVFIVSFSFPQIASSENKTPVTRVKIKKKISKNVKITHHKISIKPEVKKAATVPKSAKITNIPTIKKTKPIHKVKTFQKTIFPLPANTLLKLRKTEKSKWNIKLSGFIQLNTIYSTNSVFMAESPGWVTQNSKGGFLAFTPRHSRIRMKINAPDTFNMKTGGIFEVDFFGNLPKSSTSVRQPQPRMRLAYGELKNSNFTIRFGNDWMVAAPQFSSTLDPFNLWVQGNLWMRYPQLKLLSHTKINNYLKITSGFSLGENMSGDSPSNTIIRDPGMGNYSKMPVIQGRVGLDFKLPKSLWSTIGLSGSWQQFDLSSGDFSDEELSNIGKKMNSWFGAIDGKINYKLYGVKISGTFEYHQGKAIGMYWGGVAQTIQYLTNESGTKTSALGVKSIGYFGDLKVVFPCGFGGYVGYGKNVADEDDLVSAGSRIRNKVYYGGFTLKKGNLFFGLGASYLMTDFIADKNTKDSFVFQGVVRLSF